MSYVGMRDQSVMVWFNMSDAQKNKEEISGIGCGIIEYRLDAQRAQNITE